MMPTQLIQSKVAASLERHGERPTGDSGAAIERAMQALFVEKFSERTIRTLVRAIEKARRDSMTAGYGYAVYDLAQDKPGTLSIDIHTPLGAIERFEAVSKEESDIQSGALSKIRVQPLTSRPVDHESLAHSRSNEAFSRADDLRKLVQESPQQAAKYVADELSREDLSEEWQSVLVFFAEDTSFPATLQGRVCDRLLEIASLRREVARAGSDKVVWSALRRAASLLSQEHVNKLLQFLERRGAVDTRSVALKCVERVFEIAPPAMAEGLDQISTRVFTFALKFLDPDIFAAGENALIAQNAVGAMAALGDAKLGEALISVKRLERRWMTQQILRRLEELLASWTQRDSKFSSHPAFKNIEEQLIILR
jgi:hypothetical protein